MALNLLQFKAGGLQGETDQGVHKKRKTIETNIIHFFKEIYYTTVIQSVTREAEIRQGTLRFEISMKIRISEVY